MKLAFEFYTCTVETVATARKHKNQDAAWARFRRDVKNRVAFSAVAFLDLSHRSAVHLIASFQRHDGEIAPDQVRAQAIASVETLRNLTPSPDRFRLSLFWNEYAERVKRIPAAEFPFVDGRVYPPAHLNPGMILQEEETMMRRARLGVPAGPGRSEWLITGDGSMMTTGRCRLIPYERILQEPA